MLGLLLHMLLEDESLEVIRHDSELLLDVIPAVSQAGDLMRAGWEEIGRAREIGAKGARVQKLGL